MSLTGPDPWHNLTDAPTVPPRPVRRDMTVGINDTVFAPATTPDQWTPYEPHQYQLRPPARDLFAPPLAVYLPPPTTPDQWTPYGPTQYRLRGAQRDGTTGIVAWSLATLTIDQWAPYEPRQYRLAPPRREALADVRVSGFEATTIAQWGPYPPTQYRIPPPQRNYTTGGGETASYPSPGRTIAAAQRLFVVSAQGGT